MTIQDARKLVGLAVHLQYTDRKGTLLQASVHVLAADFVPMYGPCLVTELGEIHLEKVVSAEAFITRQAA